LLDSFHSKRIISKIGLIPKSAYNCKWNQVEPSTSIRIKFVMLYNFYSDYRVFEMGIKLEAVFAWVSSAKKSDLLMI